MPRVCLCGPRGFVWSDHIFYHLNPSTTSLSTPHTICICLFSIERAVRLRAKYDLRTSGKGRIKTLTASTTSRSVVLPLRFLRDGIEDWSVQCHLRYWMCIARKRTV